jgi:hypothetical protein
MALRSRAEIEAKISELRQSARRFGNKTALVNAVFFSLAILLVLVPTLLSQYYYGFDTNGKFDFLCISGFLAFFVLLFGYIICYFAFIDKWKTLFIIRNMIADELTLVLKSIDKPECEEAIIKKLDWVIVQRYGAKPAARITKADSVKFNRFDAAVQAYTWVVSPGMDFREKPDEN